MSESVGSSQLDNTVDINIREVVHQEIPSHSCKDITGQIKNWLLLHKNLKSNFTQYFI